MGAMLDPHIPTIQVPTLTSLLHQIGDITRLWEHDGIVQGNVRPWFRGQADAGKPLLPSVFRYQYDEFSLTSLFRLKALAFAPTPETGRLDQWLFLMQHYGLPTRLLDWTESPLLAAFFAVAQWMDSDKPEEEYDDPHMAVWMFHPLILNSVSGIGVFPNTWGNTFAGAENFKLAFFGPDQHDAIGASTFPLAVQTSAVALRVAVQRSCFTIHGKDRRDFETLLAETTTMTKGYFLKYVIPRSAAPSVRDDLDAMGISFSTVYPDLPGLGRELRERFGPKRTFGGTRPP
jgi:hypothetical protein